MSTINDNDCYHRCWERGILIHNWLEVNWWYLYRTQKYWKLNISFTYIIPEYVSKGTKSTYCNIYTWTFIALLFTEVNIYVLVTSLVGQNISPKQTWKGKVCLVLQFERKSFLAGSHGSSTVRLLPTLHLKSGSRQWLVLVLRSLSHFHTVHHLCPGIVQPTWRTDLSTSLNLTWKFPTNMTRELSLRWF